MKGAVNSLRGEKRGYMDMVDMGMSLRKATIEITVCDIEEGEGNVLTTWKVGDKRSVDGLTPEEARYMSKLCHLVADKLMEVYGGEEATVS